MPKSGLWSWGVQEGVQITEAALALYEGLNTSGRQMEALGFGKVRMGGGGGHSHLSMGGLFSAALG